MTDFLAQNSLWVVLIVVLLVWGGILGYLFRIEKKVQRLEKETSKVASRGEGA